MSEASWQARMQAEMDMLRATIQSERARFDSLVQSIEHSTIQHAAYMVDMAENQRHRWAIEKRQQVLDRQRDLYEATVISEIKAQTQALQVLAASAAARGSGQAIATRVTQWLRAWAEK